MFIDQLWTTWTDAGIVVVSGLAVLASVIVVIRVAGLRSLSKMSSFDFTVTVAIGLHGDRPIDDLLMDDIRVIE